jgi:hypothetical protein
MEKIYREIKKLLETNKNEDTHGIQQKQYGEGSL